MIFIPRSYGIFYLTAKSLLRHRKKIVLITWLLSGKFYIFNMDSNNFIRLQQFHFTVCSIMNMTAFSILLQLHEILLILVLFILDSTYLVVLVVARLKSNLERIPKHTHALWRKIYPILPGWSTCICSYDKFSFHLGRISEKSSEIPPRRAASLII